MSQSQHKLIGPFKQLLTMHNLPLKGPLSDGQLEIMNDAGILIRNGTIEKIDSFASLCQDIEQENGTIEHLDDTFVCLPGLIDCHTHLCWGGSRENDYAMRIAGKSYLEIAKEGGGILDTVSRTRAADSASLLNALSARAERHLHEGVTTCEVKSGYGLTVDQELRIITVIDSANAQLPIDLIPTCLAAHMKPKDYDGTAAHYLMHMSKELFPRLAAETRCRRIDIFIEEGAFTIEEAQPYLAEAKKYNFQLTMHVDQFSHGSSLCACELGAVSADHLECSTEQEIAALAQSDTVSVVLPGASLGLGMSFAPARKLLDEGACLAIATDWNPGSAPMGDLLLQAAILGAAEKLTTAETFAGITSRAAKALTLTDCGVLCPGNRADFIAFGCDDYREILYNQGKLKPSIVWKNGIRC